ncbi:MAG: hypothetical protein RBQ63_00025 [Acholeplasmatales bacterium]|nr:hypothetical protein [Acholeplasmatales bacterium]
MDNYEIAIKGVQFAAHLLEIETPDVQFFSNQSYSDRGINSVFLKDEYIIAFNEEWLEQADPMEVQVTCFHESRHAFQWKCINGEIQTEIDSNTIQKWEQEMSNYNQPSQSEKPEEAYLKQEIEIDAIAFAYRMMIEHFGVKTKIPEIIKDKVDKIMHFQYQEMRNTL